MAVVIEMSPDLYDRHDDIEELAEHLDKEMVMDAVRKQIAIGNELISVLGRIALLKPKDAVKAPELARSALRELLNR